MIRLTNDGPSDDGVVPHRLTVLFDEPGFVNVHVDSKGRPFVHVYRGLDTSEYSEPIGAYDPTLPENTGWESDGGCQGCGRIDPCGYHYEDCTLLEPGDILVERGTEREVGTYTGPDMTEGAWNG